MFVSKSKFNSCAVPDCTIKELTNSGRIGNNICATPVTKNSEIANSATYRFAASKVIASKPIASKPKITILRCVVPGCTSGGKSNSPKKWYVLPGFKALAGKDSRNSKSLGAVYSKLNICNKSLGKSIQICSNHYPLKDLQELNISLKSHTQDCGDRVQHINKVELGSIEKTTMKKNSGIKINLRREDLSVGQPSLNLTQMKCSDGNVHLMCSPSKPKTRQTIPVVCNGVQGQNSSRSPQLTVKPHGQVNLTINKDLRTSKKESRRVFSNSIHNISPVSNRKPTNTNVIQYKYVSADGEVIDVTVDKNDVHTKNRFHQEETPPCKNEFQFVDIHSIINSSTTCTESVEEKNSRIFTENSKHNDSENLRKVHTKDVGVQTNDTYDFDEMLHYFRKHVLKFPFRCNNQEFAIENISLFFQPLKFPAKDPIIVQVREHKLRASCDKFLKCLDYCLWQKSGKSPKELPSTYRINNGLYEVSRGNDDLGDTDEVMDSKLMNINEDESFQFVSNEDDNKRGLIASSDKSESSFSNFDKTIHEINSVETAVPNIKYLYQTDLMNQMKNREAIKNNTFSSSNKILENVHNCIIPKFNSLQMLDHTSNITDDDDKIKLLELPRIKVVNIANLRNMEEKNETREHNDEKKISDTSKRIRIEQEISPLRRSNRKKKNINFAKIMKNSLSEKYGNVQHNRNSIFNKFSKCSLKKNGTVNCGVNKKRKKCDENVSSESVNDGGNKKGKYGEMIEELEKFLELTLEQPSEDIVDISLDDSYNLGCGFSVSSSCSVNNDDKSQGLSREKYKKSPERKKSLKKLIERNSNTKKLTKTTGSVRNKYHSIKKDVNHSTKITSILTRSKTVKNLLQNKQRSKRNELKVKNDKDTKYNKKSIATSIKSSKNELGKKIKSTVCINENVDHELNLKNFKEFCSNCKQIFDKRTLACHLKMCLRKKMCDHCGLMIDNRVMWCHLRMCFHCKCEECSLTFPNILFLKEHLLSLKDCFLCENCRVIVVGSNINEHLKKCKLPDRTSNLPVKYLSYIYSNNSKRYCKLCMQSFESFLKFTKHVHSSHRNASTQILLTMKRKILKKYLKKRSKPNEYKCRFCEHISKNMQEKIDHYEACRKRIAEKCTVGTEKHIH